MMEKDKTMSALEAKKQFDAECRHLYREVYLAVIRRSSIQVGADVRENARNNAKRAVSAYKEDCEIKP